MNQDLKSCCVFYISCIYIDKKICITKQDVSVSDMDDKLIKKIVPST